MIVLAPALAVGLGLISECWEDLTPLLLDVQGRDKMVLVLVHMKVLSKYSGGLVLRISANNLVMLDAGVGLKWVCLRLTGMWLRVKSTESSLFTISSHKKQ